MRAIFERVKKRSEPIMVPMACYMVEGGGSDDYRQVKTMMYQRPDLMHKILAVNADAVALYLNTQIEGGALKAVMDDVKPDFVVIGEATQLNLARGGRGRAEIHLEAIGKPARSSCATRSSSTTRTGQR